MKPSKRRLQRRAEIFVAISRFTVANDRADAVEEAFRHRPRLVEQNAGFLRLEVLRGGTGDRDFWLMTWWTSRQAFEGWHHSPAHRASHQSIPKGLKLVKQSIEMHHLRHVCS